MNSIKQVTSGLTSSLCLAVGLTRLAEKMDPTLRGSNVQQAPDSRSNSWTEVPCNFTPQTGQ